MSAPPVMTRPIDVQRTLVEVGRIRLGVRVEFRARDGSTKTRPDKIDTWRLTSASRPRLEAAAAIYGGEVRPWQGAPDEGYWELLTTSREMRILLPPSLTAYTQAYELWDAGGCARRCDGRTEVLSGSPCLCDPQARECRILTRVSVMLRDLPGLGRWRLDTHGWNAATKLTATLDLAAQFSPGQWIPAVLMAVAKSRRIRVDASGQRVRTGGKAQTLRWVEPEIDIPEFTPGQVIEGQAVIAAPPPASLVAGGRDHRRDRVERPSLPAGPPPPSAPEAFRSHAPAPTPEPPDAAAAGAADAGVEPAATGGEASPATRCDGFHPTLGRCEREPHEGTNHRNREGETWK